MPLNDLAALLGHTVNKGVMEYKSTDTPPYVALLFESVKSNGKKRFVKLLKGKFAEPEENFQGKDTSTHWNTVKLTGHFVVREYDSAWKRVADEDAADYESTTGDSWYNTVDSTVGG